MSTLRPRLAGLAILCLSVLLTACGGSSSGGGGAAAPGDTTAPTGVASVTVLPLGDTTAIVITFNETMKSAMADYSVTGTMAGESDGGMWSMNTVTDDTLTITPTGTWTTGANRTLIINAQDLAGNPLAAMNLTYNVYRGTIYFVSSTAADDSGDGLTPATAKRNIYAANDIATGPATVVVNGGAFAADSDNAAQDIVLKADVSLFGGFSADFTARDTTANTSTITDAATTGDFGTIYGNSVMTANTIVDGFTINGPTGATNNSYPVYLTAGASATIQNNTLLARVSTSQSVGISCNTSSPLIRNNVIDGGTSLNSRGIETLFCTATIQNNIVGISQDDGLGIHLSYGGTALVENNLVMGGDNSSTFSWGIFITGKAVILRNNTIHGGNGASFARGIQLESTTTVDIQNNIVYTRSGAGSTCIYESTGTHTVNTIQNNDLFNCVTPYRDNNNGCPVNNDGDADMNTCTLADMEALADIVVDASNNVSADPLFMDIDGADNNLQTVDDNDWHLTGMSPASVTAGGLNGIDQMPAWSFTDDFDGVTRPASGNPWSMGAYEP